MAFADERDLIRAFGGLVAHFPTAALSPEARHLLVIGSEVHLEAGSTSGGAGSADLLAVDDRGELWLIEAKLQRNAQSNPWYLFGRQLSTYADALSRVGLAGIHSHLQDYAFGRRTSLAPPATLATRWLQARSLQDMLRPWLADLGRPTEATQLVEAIDHRMRSGQFLMAALVDHDDGSLAAWGRQFKNDFQTAVIVADGGNVQVPFRTDWRPFRRAGDGVLRLPPFGRIPQSFSLRPQTIPLVLNDTALRLWHEVAEPRLQAILGPLDRVRCDANATSFGYCIPSAAGPPFFVRVGRGDHRVHRGADTGNPGSHALKVDVVFKWACSEMLDMDTSRASARQEAVDSIYRLCHSLVFSAGYRFKATNHGASQSNFNGEFQRGLSARTLLVERGGLRGGPPDFGASPLSLSDDKAILARVFDSLEKELPQTRPLLPVRKPPRSNDYSEGRLEDCHPSIDLTR